MTFISKELIFIHVPKSAGTSVKNTLRQNLIEENYSNIANDDHQSYSQIIKINSKIISNRISFALVRNPYERFVSIYRFVNRPFKLNKWFGNKASEVAVKIDTFEKFIDNFIMPKWVWKGHNQFTPQYQWTAGVDKVFKLNEKEVLNNFLKNFGINKEIGHFNRQKVYSGHKEMYKDFYNENTKKIIKRYFEIDLDYFKFIF